MSGVDAKPVDPHVAWWTVARSLWDLINDYDEFDDSEGDPLFDAFRKLEEKIVATPATTLAGVWAQVRCIEIYLEESCPAEAQFTALANARATVQALWEHGRSGSGVGPDVEFARLALEVLLGIMVREVDECRRRDRMAAHDRAVRLGAAP